MSMPSSQNSYKTLGDLAERVSFYLGDNYQSVISNNRIIFALLEAYTFLKQKYNLQFAIPVFVSDFVPGFINEAVWLACSYIYISRSAWEEAREFAALAGFPMPLKDKEKENVSSNESSTHDSQNLPQ